MVGPLSKGLVALMTLASENLISPAPQESSICNSCRNVCLSSQFGLLEEVFRGFKRFQRLQRLQQPCLASLSPSEAFSKLCGLTQQPPLAKTPSADQQWWCYNWWSTFSIPSAYHQWPFWACHSPFFLSDAVSGQLLQGGQEVDDGGHVVAKPVNNLLSW